MSTDARLRYGMDDLWVTWGGPSPFGEARCEVGGGVAVHVDPARPDHLTALQIEDGLEALPVLRRLVGDGGTRGVEEAIAIDPEDEVLPAVADATPTPAVAPYCRLALAQWNLRWTPLTIPEEELLLDVGTAAAMANCFEVAADAFSTRVLYRLGVAVKSASGAPEAMRVALQQTVRAAQRTFGDRHSTAGELRTWASVLDQVTADESNYDWDDLLRQPISPMRGGGQADPVRVGSAGVDWAHVPPRLLATDESALRWRLDAGTLSVSVVPHDKCDPTSPAASVLLVRVVDARTAEPLVGGVLEYQDQQFECEIPFTHDSDFVIDVYSTTCFEDAAVGVMASASKATREAIRSLAFHRLASAATAMGESAELFNEAAADQADHTATELGNLKASVDLNDPLLPADFSALDNWFPTSDSYLPADYSTGIPVPAAAGADQPLLSEMLLLWRGKVRRQLG